MKRAAPIPQPRERRFYSIDVITDGSNFTGHGTVFLSVLRPSATEGGSVGREYDATTATILARYAFGCGEMSTGGRLCADQRQKVGTSVCATCRGMSPYSVILLISFVSLLTA